MNEKLKKYLNVSGRELAQITLSAAVAAGTTAFLIRRNHVSIPVANQLIRDAILAHDGNFKNDGVIHWFRLYRR